MTGDAQTLMGIYASSGFMKLIGVIKILSGLLLISGKYVSLGLTFIVAIFFNAALFHAFHDMAVIGMALEMFEVSLILVFLCKEKFSSLFTA